MAEGDGTTNQPQRVSGVLKVGQLLIFLVGTALLLANTFNPWISRHWHVAVVINAHTFELLGAMAIALLVFRVTSFKVSASGVSGNFAGLEAARQGVAGVKALLRPDSAPITELAATPLTAAPADPLVALEQSRRTLDKGLFDLARAAQLDDPAPEPTVLARQLEHHGAVPADTAAAVDHLTTAIDQAKATGAPSPAVALEVDYGTQLLDQLLSAKRVELAPDTASADTSPSPVRLLSPFA